MSLEYELCVCIVKIYIPIEAYTFEIRPRADDVARATLDRARSRRATSRLETRERANARFSLFLRARFVPTRARGAKRIMPRRRAARDGGGDDDDARMSWMRDEVDDARAMDDARFATFDREYVSLRDGSNEADEEEEDEDGLMDVDDETSDDDDDETSKDDDSSEENEDDEDDEDDFEYSDSEEMALAKAMKAQKKRLEGRVRRDAVTAEDEDEDEDEDENGGFGIEGRRKMDFYGDDDVDHEGLSDEEDRVEEEKEARRVRKLMAEEMRAEDFGVESEEDESDESDDDGDAKATLGAKAANLRRGDGKKASSASKSSKKKTSVSVETLTAEERAERLAAEDDATAANDAPELIALSKELTSTLASIEASVEPLVKAAKDGAFATEDGVSYLDTKYLLMLSYCSSIVFYLLLKAEGRSVKDHPVIERLVEIRLYLEKLRPIDKKLQYQVRVRLTTEKHRADDSISSVGRRVAVMQTLTRIGLTTH